MNKKPKNKAFSYSVYNKSNFRTFCELKEIKTAKIIRINDLPSEFNEDLCNFINLFRRKTINEQTEWEFYIDYENNEIIHCLHGKETNVNDWIHSGLMKNKKILSIHNHLQGTYSAPSAENFEVLKHEIEDYEIICATNEFWILEAKGQYSKYCIKKIRKKIRKIFFKWDIENYNPNKCETYDSNEEYSKNLTKYINNLKNNIKLSKKEYR